MRLLGKLQAAWNVSGAIAQQNADGIFSLCNLSFQIRNFCRRGIYQLFSLPHIQQRLDSMLLEGLGQLQRVPARGQCALRNLEL
jgi:hypothetical protein